MPDGKVWMAENLDFAWSGLTVGGSGTSSNPKANYYDNDEVTYGWNGRKCGLLYNWYAAKHLEDNKSTLIPGWHVPTKAEWDALATAAEAGVATIAELRTVKPSAGMCVNVDGYYRSGDCPSRRYLWVENASNYDDGGYIIASTVDNGGRWATLSG